jgi:uncharacterized glyoxalase superfamily protein PhnB
VKVFTAIPVLHVANIEKALHFYTEVLGFTEEFRFGEYLGLRLSEAGLHLAKAGDDNTRPAGGGTVYLICDAVDEYYDAIVNRGAEPRSKPCDAGYGMRDFVVPDPDGNQLSFGCEVAPAKAANDD